jgi:hypothetical protein
LSVPQYQKCKFIKAWIGPCNALSTDEFCTAHDGISCSSCGQQATQECDFAGQFVCGARLCDDCHGYNEPGPSGSWGFIGHRHKRKEAPTKAEQEQQERNETSALVTESAALGRDGEQ